MQHSRLINILDIGSTKITTLVGQHFPGENRFNIVAIATNPCQGFRKSQIVDLELASQVITKSIESAERMAGFQINHAHVGISAPYIESINSKGVVATSNQSGEIEPQDVIRVIEAAKAITLPVGKEIIHVIPRIFTVDGQDGITDPVGMTGVRLEVESHLIFASTPALKNLKKCLEDVGVNIDSLTFSGLATAKISLTDTEKELGVALVDIGGSTTTITIFSEKSPVYCSVLPLGASNVTNDLAIGLRFSIDDAEKIKTQLDSIYNNNKFEDEIDLTHFGIVSSEKRRLSLQTAINGIIKPRLEEIFNLIYQRIESSGFQNNIPAGIVLTGGGAQTVNAKEVCSQIIPLPLRIAQPPKVGGLVDEILNPSFTSSIGLLYYCEETSKTQKPNHPQTKSSFPGIFGKFKSLIEPLLP